MKQKWIISANSKKYNHTAAFAKYGYIDWKQMANYNIGDEVYIYCVLPCGKIMYKTEVVDVNMSFADCTDDKEFWLDLKAYEDAKTGQYARLKLVEQADNDYLSYENLVTKFKFKAPQRVAKMRALLAEYVDKYLYDSFIPKTYPESDIPEDCYEGAKLKITINKYERSSVARRKCIDKHGYACSVCGMNFKDIYGEIGEGFIHIHHIIPISTIGTTYKIDYANDLIPVCPNCHAMLHKGNLSIEELKDVIESNR